MVLLLRKYCRRHLVVVVDIVLSRTSVQRPVPRSSLWIKGRRPHSRGHLDLLLLLFVISSHVSRHHKLLLWIPCLLESDSTSPCSCLRIITSRNRSAVAQAKDEEERN